MICHTTDEVTSVQHFQRYVIKQTMTVCLRSDGLPQIENKIVELTEQLTNGVRQNLTEMKEAIQSNSATVQDGRCCCEQPRCNLCKFSRLNLTVGFVLFFCAFSLRFNFHDFGDEPGIYRDNANLSRADTQRAPSTTSLRP
jgi:hypothetical protein